MKILINSGYDCEEILTNELEDYFFNKVKFKNMFPNFGNIRIDTTHPFALLLDTQINGTPESRGLFPSITIADNSSSKDLDANTATIKTEDLFDLTCLTQIKENRDAFKISPSDFKLLDDYFKDNPQGEIHFTRSTQKRKSSFVIEIWTQNKSIKNTIYDLCLGFFSMYGRYSLKSNYDIIINEESVSGEKSGNYNYDFGGILYGAFIRAEIVYKISQYDLDSDVVIIGSAESEIDSDDSATQNTITISTSEEE